MSKPIRRSTLALAVFLTALLVTGAVDAGPNTSTLPRESSRITLVRGMGGVVGSPAGEYLVRVQYTAREKQDKPLAIAKMLRWHLEIERLAA